MLNSMMRTGGALVAAACAACLSFSLPGLPASASLAGAAAAATPPPCGAPALHDIRAEPDRVVQGETATVTVTVREQPCTQEPPHDVTLYTRRADSSGETQVVASGRTDDQGQVAFAVQPEVSRDYSDRADFPAGQESGGARTVRITVDSRPADCAGAVSVSGPGVTRAGSAVTLDGSSDVPGEVTVLFRKRGESQFVARRLLRPDAWGRFSTTYVANDDYRYYATASGCASPIALTTVNPAVEAPARAARFAPVSLTVRSVPDVLVQVYFRRAGSTTFELRRTGRTSASGIYRTQYVSAVDHRYYAVTGPNGRVSNVGLTQVG